MQSSLSLLTASVTEPVSLQEMKDHLRQDDSADDAYIKALTVAASNHTEMFTRRKWINATYDWSFRWFPAGRIIRLFAAPLAPLSSVPSITYIDTDGTSQTLATSVYVVDTGVAPGEIELKFDQSWPSTRDQRNAVTIRQIVGYGAGPTSVPEEAQAAIKLLVGTWYANRESAVIGTITAELPDGVQSLLWGLRIVEAV